MFKILVDAYGADRGPSEVVAACLVALARHDNIEIELVGKEQELKNLLAGKKYDENRLTITNADEIITCNEAPVEAIRTKKNSSLVVCIDKLKNGGYAGMVSAGSTGAVLSGSVLKLGRLSGLSRPALAPMLPTIKGGRVLLIDCGANVDCKPINLCHFALMGSEYMRVIQGVKQPRVALLNVGTEEAKGNELTKTSYEIMQKLPINFVGNIEARDALSGDCDVIVTDGFSGNVLLKSIEGTIQALLSVIKSGLKSTLKGKIGGLIIKKPLKAVLKRYDYQAYGGSPLLGTKQIVVKTHGSADVTSLLTSIEQVLDFAEKDLLTKLGNTLSENKLDIDNFA